MSKQKHIIKKQLYDLKLSDRNIAFNIQNKVSSLNQSKITGTLDEICSAVIDENDYLQIDKLELDLGRIALENLENEIEEKIRIKFLEELNSKYNSAARADVSESEFEYEFPGRIKESVLITGTKHKIDILKIYLLTGNLPWHEIAEEYTPSGILEELISKHPGELKRMLSEISGSEKVLERIFVQFSESSVALLLNLLKSDLKKETIEFINDFYELIEKEFNFYISSKMFNEILIRNLLRILRPYYLTGIVTEDVKVLDLLKQEEIILKTSGALISKITPAAISEIERIESFIEKLIVIKKKYITAAAGLSTISRHVVYEFDEMIVKNILAEFSLPEKEKLTAKLKDFIEIAIEPISKTKPEDEIGELLEKTLTEEEIEKIKRRIDKAKLKEETEEAEKEAIEIDELFIDNAGLVILSPFFPKLFQVLGLMEDGIFNDETHAKRAVHVLQYLANGDRKYEEVHLPLNKILCGLEIYDVADNNFQITKNEKEECESLIKAAINNWEALKNTSVEGFRNSFLVRRGRLTKNGNDWSLLVDRKVYDMLLEKLPWSISIIKHKWMNRAVFVEW